jgi:hypothetical protein
VLRALMEIRALSPHHSSGLKRAKLQRRFGKRRSDRFAIKREGQPPASVFSGPCYATARVR